MSFHASGDGVWSERLAVLPLENVIVINVLTLKQAAVDLLRGA
jgi:hypothetical protein